MELTWQCAFCEDSWTIDQSMTPLQQERVLDLVREMHIQGHVGEFQEAMATL